MADSSRTRRRFATTVLTAAIALPFARLVHADAADEPSGVAHADRWIELLNSHTGEVVSVVFSNAQGFVPEGLERLQYLLRDYRTGEQRGMDPALYVQLSELARTAGCEPRFEVISGYRSPATNSLLRSRGRAVAEHSLHMEGRAIDVRLKGCKCSTLRDLAMAAGRGGVGYYARSDFVHIDTGRVRYWQG
jgi:uncharacterized protein YcbK (DUF882 family)